MAAVSSCSEDDSVVSIHHDPNSNQLKLNQAWTHSTCILNVQRSTTTSTAMDLPWLLSQHRLALAYVDYAGLWVLSQIPTTDGLLSISGTRLSSVV